MSHADHHQRPARDRATPPHSGQRGRVHLGRKATRAPRDQGWSDLFWEAFKRSKSAMALLDGRRRHVEVNGAWLQLLGYRRAALIGRPVYEFVIGGPLATTEQWKEALRREQFTGVADLLRADGGTVTVDFAGHPAVVTGTQLVLFVVMSSSRGRRRSVEEGTPIEPPVPLSERERQVVGLIALGWTGPEIAEELQLAHNTVRTHVRNAMTKVGSRSRAQLVAKSLGEGLHHP